MKCYKNLWVFGGSNSVTGYCVDPIKSYWGLTANWLGVDNIYNFSWIGNSFDSVCHTLITQQPKYDWQNDFFLIGVPPLERWTVFDNHKDTVTTATRLMTNNWQVEEFEVESHHGLENISFYNDKSTVLFEDRAWTEVMAMKTIFLLNSWLDSKHANYLIVNQSKDLDLDNIWRPSEFLLPACSSHDRNILFEKGYYSVNLNKHKPADFKQHGWMGHHGPAGNQHFFETSIKDRLC
jgi:hypothetical protein